nr:hypothetical protein [Tanacetum cinerariifolium]
MVESSMVRDHDMEESSMLRDQDMGESPMVWDHDMVDSSMVRDDQVDNQIVVLPEDLKHPEYYTLPSKELVRLFWADETMKCNYVAFGDVVSFDATFHTNKYGYKFVPFTGINHNQRCVTFGAALLFDETTESFSWKLEAFLKTHKKQPSFAVTDQDGALRNAVVLGDLAADNNFRKDFHKL